MVPDVASWAQLVVKNPLANAEDLQKQVWSLGQEDPLEEWILQPSLVFLPGEIPWTEEPGRLQSTESQSQTQLSKWPLTPTR